MGATTRSKATTQQQEDVVPRWYLVEEQRKASDTIKALEREIAQLKQELARERGTAGGGEGETSHSEKRRRTAAIESAKLPRLPTEIWTEIAKAIDENDVMAFALTSRQHREAQQQAGRELVTRPVYKDESGSLNSLDFTSSWCAWWSRRFHMSETRDDCMEGVIRVAVEYGHVDVLKTY